MECDGKGRRRWAVVPTKKLEDVSKTVKIGLPLDIEFLVTSDRLYEVETRYFKEFF